MSLSRAKLRDRPSKTLVVFTLIDKKKNMKLIFIILSCLCLIPGVTTAIALAGGLLFGIFVGCPFPEKINKFTKYLLQASVVGLGFGIPLADVLKAGKEGLLLSLISIGFSLLIGYLLSRWLQVRKKTGILISVGTAICGGSAIAAVAPAIEAQQEDISISIGSIFILNSIALFLFPPIGKFFHLLPEQFGVWSALAIHDTSSVVGASSVFGEKALAVATTVKLSRAIWILPLTLMFALINKRDDKKRKITIPWFIFLFVLAAALSSFMPLKIFSYLSAIAKQALSLVLFWIGSTMNKKSIRNVGWRPFILAIALWMGLAITSLIYVSF